MDRVQFDALTKGFAQPQSRRAALAAFLSAALLGFTGRVQAKPGKGVEKGHHRGRGKGHDPNSGHGHAGDEPCPRPCAPDPITGLSGFCCKDGSCSCAGACCGDRCVRIKDAAGTLIDEFCCEGPRRLANGVIAHLVYCPDNPETRKCCHDVGETSCTDCLDTSGLAGSYRRPR